MKDKRGVDRQCDNVREIRWVGFDWISLAHDNEVAVCTVERDKSSTVSITCKQFLI